MACGLVTIWQLMLDFACVIVFTQLIQRSDLHNKVVQFVSLTEVVIKAFDGIGEQK